MNKVIIGLGSNIEPEKNIENARATLKENFQILGESKFIQTKPVGLVDQADFINGAVLINTGLKMDELESKLKKLEKNLGRIETDVKFGPRSIDLDIVTWNREIIDQDFYTRDFLKNSVLELIPDLEYQGVK